MSPHSGSRTVVLIGMRACGKSTVGPAIAEQLGTTFIDLDELVAAEFSEPTITEIWRVRGEAAWRKAELRSLEWIFSGECDQPGVLALGGGVPCIPAAREILSYAKTIIVYLHAPAELLSERLEAIPGDRPSLTGAEVPTEVAAVLADRDPVYRQLATRVIDVEDRSSADIADTVIESLDG